MADLKPCSQCGVPPKMANEKRLIDAYKLEDLIRSNSARYHNTDDVIAAIAGQPAVDAVEVVHGRWVFGTANHREYMKCSVCLKSQTPTGVFTYCPNCGARMDGGNEDGAAQV